MRNSENTFINNKHNLMTGAHSVTNPLPTPGFSRGAGRQSLVVSIKAMNVASQSSSEERPISDTRTCCFITVRLSQCLAGWRREPRLGSHQTCSHLDGVRAAARPSVCSSHGPMAATLGGTAADLNGDEINVLQRLMAEHVGTYRSNPISMPGSFFVNKLLKISNQAIIHSLRGDAFPFTGETVVTLVGVRLLTIKFTGSIRQDGTRCWPALARPDAARYLA